ncbi:MAG: putative rane protein [Bacteroidetes bacterium]|jgi:type IX secretion system PorP/SprF family membrane protein|nr:putative rane protein [Bacteroidota bacterium]
MKKAVCIIFVCICSFAKAQHNSAYSQYMFNMLLVNPAYAGSQDALNLTGLYREQWVGIDGAPRTLTLSAHTPFKNKKLNAGIVFSNDRISIYDHNRVSAMYAYRIKAGKGFLSFGLQAGINSFRQNWQNINTTQANDVSFQVAPVRNILPETGFGIYYHSQRFFMGAAVPSVLIDGQSTIYSPANLYTGAVLNAGTSFKIRPAVLLKYVKGSPLSLDVNTIFYWRDVLGLGLGYRMNDAAMALVDLKLNDQLRIGYCYDYTLSKLRNYSNGSHEFMIRYLFFYKLQPAKGMRYF